MSKAKTIKAKPVRQVATALYLERLLAEVIPLPGDDLCYALTDGADTRLLREDGKFDDIETLSAFQAACEKVGDPAEVVAVTSTYLNSPCKTYWLLVSAPYSGQPVQGRILIAESEGL